PAAPPFHPLSLHDALPISDAIDTMSRALKAGHPFNATLRMIAEDMEDPIAGEFELTFGDINYGNDLRRAMLGLLTRAPSVTMMADRKSTRLNSSHVKISYA